MRIDSYTALGGPETIAFIDAPITQTAGEVLTRIRAALGQRGDVMERPNLP